MALRKPAMAQAPVAQAPVAQAPVAQAPVAQAVPPVSFNNAGGQHEESYEEPYTPPVQQQYTPPVQQQYTPQNLPAQYAPPQAVAVVASPPPAVNFQGDMTAAGFQGLELGFGSFPIIVLDKGMFLVKGGEHDGLTLSEIQYSVLRSMRRDQLVGRIYDEVKRVYDMTDKETDLHYVYVPMKSNGTYVPDSELLTEKGYRLLDAIADMEARGLDVTRKQYIEVEVLMQGGDLTGEIVLLSIAPTSVKRFSGFLRMQEITQGWRTPEQKAEGIQQMIVASKAGAAVTGAGGNDFNPWTFRRVQ